MNIIIDHDQIQTIQFKLDGTDIFHKLHSLLETVDILVYL